MPDAPATLPPPNEIRGTALEIVQRGEYDLRIRDGSEGFEFFEKIRAALERVFSPLGSALDALYESSPWAYWIVMAMLVLLLFGLLGHILWTVRKTLERRRRTIELASEEKPAEMLASEWEERAREAAMAGHFIEAVRCLFRAALTTLEAAGHTKVRRGATNREYLRRYGRTPAAAPLQTFVDIIDNRWYAGRDCAREEFDACTRAYDVIRQVAKDSASHVARA